MNNVPTLSEYWNEKWEKSGWSIEKIIIEFAKLHVKAALEVASEVAVAKENPADYGTGEIWVDKNSILKAYPETNIK